MILTPNTQKRIIIKSEDERLVFGEVYIPLHVDTDGEAMTADEIRKMAYDFLASGRINKIDTNHNYKENGCVVVESFIARKNDPDGFVEGAWVAGVYITKDELWKGIKKGDFNGFSFGGIAHSIDLKAIVKVSRKMIGETEDSTDSDIIPAHSHRIDLNIDVDGMILDGETEESFGHKHRVLRSSATEKSLEHSHRLVLVGGNE